MTDDAPTSPAEPRDGEPYYIDSECPNCGTGLELYDSFSVDQIEESEALGVPTTDSGDGIWHDEWVCPRCVDGIHLDVPVGWLEGLSDRVGQNG